MIGTLLGVAASSIFDWVVIGGRWSLCCYVVSVVFVCLLSLYSPSYLPPPSYLLRLYPLCRICLSLSFLFLLFLFLYCPFFCLSICQVIFPFLLLSLSFSSFLSCFSFFLLSLSSLFPPSYFICQFFGL